MSEEQERQSDLVLQALRDRFPDTLLDLSVSATEMDFTVAPDALDVFVAALRDTVLPPRHLFVDLCGVEREDSIEAVYRLALVTEPVRIVIRARAPKSRPALPTLSHLYKGALWPERELAEMFGVIFVGHPDPRHLLLPEGWEGYPLRKDYQYPLDHPYLAPEPLRDDPLAILAPAEDGGAAANDNA